MTPHHREVLAYVAEIGGIDGHIEHRGQGAHPRVRFVLAGRDYAVVIGSTPSDGNAIWSARRYIRRTIGLEQGRHIGERRTARACRERPWRPIHTGPIAFPPDWRDALRRHPLYLAAIGAEAAA